MPYHFRNLVFEGGGVKGIAYVGALRVLARKRILRDIERVGGTSAGAINAVLLALDYKPKETEDILGALDFKNFMDHDWGLVRDTERLIHRFGWYKGDFFREWMANLIRKKTGDPNCTFAELHRIKDAKGFRELYMVGTNLSTGYAEVFSHEHTPRTCIADAVRISMSIPLFFSSIRSPRGDVYADGGLLDNYPVKLFDRAKYIDTHSVETDYYKKDTPGSTSNGSTTPTRVRRRRIARERGSPDARGLPRPSRRSCCGKRPVLRVAAAGASCPAFFVLEGDLEGDGPPSPLIGMREGSSQHIVRTMLRTTGRWGQHSRFKYKPVGPRGCLEYRFR